MRRNDHRLKLAFGAMIAIGFIVVWVSSTTTTTTVAPTTTLAPTATASTTITQPTGAQGAQGTPGTATAPTPTTTVSPIAVEGAVLSRTGSSTLPLFIIGVVLVVLGTALELSARRRKLQSLTLRPLPTVGIADILCGMAQSRQAAASEPERVSVLASAQSQPRTPDTCLWRYLVW